MSATSRWGGRRRSRCSPASMISWRTTARRILPSGSTTPPRKSGADLERDEIGFAPPLNQSPFVPASEAVNLSNSDLILRSPSEARASRRMAASPNLLPWFETARCARLLTMRPSVLSSCQTAKIERFTAAFAGNDLERTQSARTRQSGPSKAEGGKALRYLIPTAIDRLPFSGSRDMRDLFIVGNQAVGRSRPLH